MKKSILPLLLLLTFCFSASAQKADHIIGTWWTEGKKSKVEIFKKDGKYYGKIVELTKKTNPDGSTPRKDLNNPDPKKRDRNLVGTLILRDLEWDEGDNEWDDGTIYDPESGSTYDMYAKLEDANTLFLKGYIGISLIGRSTLWKRAE